MELWNYVEANLVLLHSIDDDIISLVDEFELKSELKQAAEAIVDSEKFSLYLNQKSIVALDKFLDYLPKMRIPLSNSEVVDGWILSCRASDGGDLCLSSVNIKRENMVCRTLGDATNKLALWTATASLDGERDDDDNIEESILNDVRDLIANAQQYGCWVNEDRQFECTPYVKSAMRGMPVSEVLHTAIELWHDLEIDDDELMEIAIKDVSYQISIHNSPKAAGSQPGQAKPPIDEGLLCHPMIIPNPSMSKSQPMPRRFNPKKDSTILHLEMKQLSCKLEDFKFRLAPKTRLTIFDPVFEGTGTLEIRDLSLTLGVECKRERIAGDVMVPVLQLKELQVSLDEVKLRFSDTGLDWLLNPILIGLREGMTEIIEGALREQLGCQLQEVLEHANSYIESNPQLLLHVLGCHLEDLEENVAWV